MVLGWLAIGGGSSRWRGRIPRICASIGTRIVVVRDRKPGIAPMEGLSCDAGRWRRGGRPQRGVFLWRAGVTSGDLSPCSHRAASVMGVVKGCGSTVARPWLDRGSNGARLSLPVVPSVASIHAPDGSPRRRGRRRPSGPFESSRETEAFRLQRQIRPPTNSTAASTTHRGVGLAPSSAGPSAGSPPRLWAPTSFWARRWAPAMPRARRGAAWCGRAALSLRPTDAGRSAEGHGIALGEVRGRPRVGVAVPALKVPSVPGEGRRGAGRRGDGRGVHHEPDGPGGA